jgi:endoglycosylceramidase
MGNVTHDRRTRARRGSPAVAVAVAAAILAATLTVGATGATPTAAQPAPQPPGPVAGWSTTEGTDGRVYIADDQGRALQFHGFNVKTTDPATDASDTLLADAAARGMDHMRLAVFWDLLEPAEGAFDEAYLDEIVAALDRAERHGLLVILDMHQDVYGEAFGSHGVPAWATRTDGLPYVPQSVWFLNYLQPAVQAAWEHLYEDEDLRQFQIRAWLHVVDRVQDHPSLFGYDLLNEPFGKIREGEDLFTAAERVEREQLTAMFQRLTDAISGVDPHHWVFFEPPNLASLGIPTSLGEIRGPKVAVYPHMYDPNIETATYTPGGVVEYDPGFFPLWAAATTVYTDTYPVPLLVGEWGIANPDRPGMDAFVRDSLATLEQVGSGWSVFNWCRGTGYCPLDVHGNDRPAIGQIFQPYARAIAGAPTSTVWDPQARTLQVTFTADGAAGPTEIYVHQPVYPEGWTVEAGDPAGEWSHTFDPVTRVLSVTTPDDGGAHTICVQPEGTEAACGGGSPGPDPGGPGGAGSGGGSGSGKGPIGGIALPAVPVLADPDYTG